LAQASLLIGPVADKHRCISPADKLMDKQTHSPTVEMADEQTHSPNDEQPCPTSHKNTVIFNVQDGVQRYVTSEDSELKLCVSTAMII